MEQLKYTCKNPFCKAEIPAPDPALYSTLFCDDCKHFIIDDQFRAKGKRTRGAYKLKIKVTQDYIDELVYRMIQYIDNPRNSSGVPSIKGFCFMNSIGHGHLKTVLGTREEVKDAIERLKDSADYILSEKMVNKFNPGIIFYLKQLEWRDNPEVVINNNEPPEYNNTSDDKLNEIIDKLNEKRDKAVE